MTGSDNRYKTHNLGSLRSRNGNATCGTFMFVIFREVRDFYTYKSEKPMKECMR